MQEIVTKEGLRRIGIIVAVAVLCLAAYYPVRPAARHKKRLKEADRYMNMIADALGGDARYTNMVVASCTEWGNRVYLGIGGTVAEEDDLADLHRIVTSINPDFPVQWQVRVRSEFSSGENMGLDMDSVDGKIPWQISQTNLLPVPLDQSGE